MILDPDDDLRDDETLDDPDDLEGLDEDGLDDLDDDEVLGGPLGETGAQAVARRLGLATSTIQSAGVGVVGERSASPGLRQLLAEATPRASAGLQELVANSVAATTRAAYEADWARFELWCAVRGTDALDAGPLEVAEYINVLVRERLAYTTITRRVAAIGYALQLATTHRPTDDPLVTTTLAGARRLLAGRAKRQAAPLRLAEWRTIITGLPIVAPNHPAMRRDQTLLAIGWAAALRSSELVGLDVDDCHFVGDPDTGDGGVLLQIRAGKGHPGAQWVAVPYASTWSWCPVRRLAHWTRTLRTGPLFRRIDRHGHTHGRLTAPAVTSIVRTRLVEVCQLDADQHTSHSLRAGFVTEARAHGADDTLIARHTRHTRPGTRTGGLLNVYDRPTDLFERTPFEGWW